MAATPYVVANPRENNRLLRVTVTTAAGTRTLAVLKPGEQLSVDQPVVGITQVAMPARLQVCPTTGLVSTDQRRTGPRVRAKP